MLIKNYSLAIKDHLDTNFDPFQYELMKEYLFSIEILDKKFEVKAINLQGSKHPWWVNSLTQLPN